MEFDPRDFLLPSPASPGCESPPLGSSLHPAPLAEAAPSPLQGATAQAGGSKFAALRVRLPWQQAGGSAASPGGSPERGPSPASTASASSERWSPSRRVAAAAGAAVPWPLGDSECSEACSSHGSEAAGSDEPAGAAAAGLEPSDGGASGCSPSGSAAGTPQPGAAGSTSIDGLPEQACITPPACQLSSGSSTVDAGRRTPSGLSPAQQVEVLQARLEAEAAARAAAQRHLAEQREEAERQRQALGEQFEARLAALRRELQDAAEAGAGVELSRSILVGGEAAHCAVRRVGLVAVATAANGWTGLKPSSVFA